MTPPHVDANEAWVTVASRTDVGRVRSANEDSCNTCLRADGTRLLVVADGMGGHRGGATASRTAVEIITKWFDTDTRTDFDAMLRAAIDAANTRIHEIAQADAEFEGMGTTVVALALAPDGRASVAHVGDSRAYRCRRGQLEALTLDHSVVAEMQRRGLISSEEAAAHPRRNEILRSVGVLPEVAAEISAVEVRAGDRFMLCSDGLSGVVSDDEIAAIVASQSPQSTVDTLIGLANERGGPDNITAQVLAIPDTASDLDPESTAPVRLSEAGIAAIQHERRAGDRRARLSRLLLIGLALVLAFVLWQLSARGKSTEAENTATLRAADGTENAQGAEAEAGAEPPRQGIPR